MLFLEQPFQLSLCPESFSLCNGRVQSSEKARSEVRGSTDARAAVSEEQGE